MTVQLSDLAYNHLKGKLFNSEFTPGTKISENRIASELQISRTPAREAIRRLEAEGLLRQVACSGTFVEQPDRTKLIEVYEVRMALESFAIKKAVERIRPRQIRELKRLCDQMLASIKAYRDSGAAVMEGAPLQQYLTADMEFHMLLLRVAGNEHAMKIICDVHVRGAIFGFRSHERNLSHLSNVWRQHARVVRAVRQRDQTAARFWLEQHMSSSLEAALSAFDAQQSNQDSMPPLR